MVNRISPYVLGFLIVGVLAVGQYIRIGLEEDGLGYGTTSPSGIADSASTNKSKSQPRNRTRNSTPKFSVSEDAFWLVAVKDSPQASAVPKDKLIQLGRNVCKDLDVSQDFYDTTLTLIEAWLVGFGEPLEFSAAENIVGAAVGALCEKHDALLP